MNLVFNSTDRNTHTELKKRLDDNSINYKVLDDDAFRVGFKVSKDKVNDLQSDLAVNIMGNSIQGNFFIED